MAKKPEKPEDPKYANESREEAMIPCPLCSQPTHTYSRQGRIRYQKCKGTETTRGCGHTFTVTAPPPKVDKAG